MSSSSDERRPSPWPLMLVVMVVLLTGCGASDAGKPEKKVVERADTEGLETQLDSANYYLAVADLDKFRPGRSRSEVLEDLHWRAASVVMTEWKGKAVSAITYDLLSDASQDDPGEVWLHAMFVNDHFVKFIHWLPGEMEEVPYEGTTWRRPKAISLADSSWLVRALDSTPVSIENLREEAKSASAPPGHTDIGLTIAWLLLRPGLRIQTPNLDDYRRNAALRDQFNAARLSTGMTESQVELIFRAKPLEQGNVEGAVYKIYGSNESFNIEGWLHFSNVLVIFRRGKSKLVISVRAGDEWRRTLGETFFDLPKPVS